MKPVRPTLIELFSRLSCVEIELSTQHLIESFDATSFDQLSSMPKYDEEYNRVKAAKRTIERIGTKYSRDNGDQALQCLCLLKDLRAKTVYESDDYATTRELIEKTLCLHWPKPDQLDFDQRRKVLDRWSDFFISYTNRDSNATNKRYRELISNELGWPRKAEIEARNYVARVIAKCFEQQNLRGFVDFKGLQCGDEIEAKIVQHCQSAIAFVQLVEGAALTEPPPPKVNWCHTEYNEFTRAGFPGVASKVQVNRRFFVLAGSGQLAKPAKLGQPYHDWFQDMSARLHIVIDDLNAKPFDDLKFKVREVANQIVTARTELIDSMLATWI